MSRRSLPSVFPRLVAVLIVTAASSGVIRAQEVPDPADRRAGALFVRGMTRAFLGDDEQAAALYREALSILPDDPAMLGAMAGAQRRLGDLESALFFARRADAVDTGRPDAGLLVADLLAATGRPGEAATRLDDLAARFPDRIDVLAARADLLYRTEQRAAARDAYGDLLDRYPGDEEALSRLLDLEITLGHLDAALPVLDELERGRPSDTALLQRRAELLVQLGRTDEAVRVFERILTLSPGHREASEALASLRPGGDDTATGLPVPERSAAEWLAVVDSDPRNVGAWSHAVSALSTGGRIDEALATADDGLLLFPGDAALQLAAGHAALLALLPQRASSYFSNAARALDEHDTTDPAARSAAILGAALATTLTGDEELGTIDLDEIGNAVPEGAPAYAALALARRAPGRALELARSALRGNPTDAVALVAGALATAETETPEAGFARLEGVTRAESAAPLLLVVAGDLARRAGRTADADALYRRAATVAPASTVVQSRLDRP